VEQKRWLTGPGLSVSRKSVLGCVASPGWTASFRLSAALAPDRTEEGMTLAPEPFET
jgi:hypothetical protein